MKTLHYIEVAEGGRITRSGSLAAPSLDYIRAHAEGEIVQLGAPLADCGAYRYDGRGLVRLPDRPSPDHSFDYGALQWRLEPAVAWAKVRARRDALLAASDWVTLRAQETGAPVPPEWLAYRQALRDVTQQQDPEAIEWPASVASMPTSQHGQP